MSIIEKGKVKAYRVTRPDFGSAWVVYRDMATLVDAEFTDDEVGDKVHIETVQMTEKELDELPEFKGW